jgi:hypothetical protein
VSIRGRVLDGGLGLLAASQLVLAGWLVPAGDRVLLADGRPLGGACVSHALFGIDCPMCGMTRSFVALAHGDVAAAFAFHPAGPLLFVAMLACVVAIAIVAVRRAVPLVQRRGFWRVFQAVAYSCIAIGMFNVVRS